MHVELKRVLTRYFTAAADDYLERIKPLPPREKSSMSFFKKFIELQVTMLHQNSQLTQSHPYATGPLNWPFLLQGISFWTENSTLQQIYMIGNVVGWWITILSVSVFVGIMAADTLARRRGLEPIEPEMYSRMLNSAGFFFGNGCCAASASPAHTAACARQACHRRLSRAAAARCSQQEWAGSRRRARLGGGAAARARWTGSAGTTHDADHDHTQEGVAHRRRACAVEHLRRGRGEQRAQQEGALAP